MNYELLSKVFYKNKSKYEQLYKERIGNKDSVYQLPINIKEHPAFIVISKEVFSLVQKIYHRNNKLTRLYNKLPRGAIEVCLSNLLIEEIMLTNDIEGIYSSRSEIHMVLKGKNQNKIMRFRGLAQTYKIILEKSDIPIKNSQDIRELYDRTLLNDIETEERPDGIIFRKNSVSVYSSTDKELHRGVLPEEKLITEMDSVLKWLNYENNIPKIVRVAAFHYLFGYLHPFYDGNGRLSRLLASYLLKETLNHLVSLRISYIINKRKQEYYDAFEICNDSKNRGDLTSFIITFLSFIYDAIESLIEKLTEFDEKMRFYDTLLNEKFNRPKNQRSVLYILIQSTLFANMPLTISELSEEINRSEVWTGNLLKKLCESGFVKKQREGRSMLYSANFEKIDKL